MDKQTIFFSHSTKDSDLLLPIKKKIEDITSGVLEIFMSSDGQSIPFGHNWVHKIEEGLRNAQIMFVFVTPNSINSAWIYFEAGYVYSKGIEVVPIGIGINIDQLRAPLNLLQGFNVMSGDSLNNFVSIINEKFGTQFKEQFAEMDFEQISSFFEDKRNDFEVSNIFTHAEYQLCSQYFDSEHTPDRIIRHDIDKCFMAYKQHLDSQGIHYSSNTKTILVAGMRIDLVGNEKEPETHNGKLFPVRDHLLRIRISMYDFERSFDLLRELSVISDINIAYLHFYFAGGYTCMKSSEDVSAILSEHRDAFSHSQKDVNSFCFMNDLEFTFFEEYARKTSNDSNFILSINFNILKVEPPNIIELIRALTEMSIILEK